MNPARSLLLLSGHLFCTLLDSFHRMKEDVLTIGEIVGVVMVSVIQGKGEEPAVI